MDKFKIVEIAIDMAADDGVEYDDLSPGSQMSDYKKAYEERLRQKRHYNYYMLQRR